MQSPIINATNEMLLSAVKRLYQRKEITLEQYAASLRRSFLKTPFTPKDSANYPLEASNAPLANGFSGHSNNHGIITSFFQKPKDFIKILKEEGVDYVD